MPFDTSNPPVIKRMRLTLGLHAKESAIIWFAIQLAGDHADDSSMFHDKDSVLVMIVSWLRTY